MFIRHFDRSIAITAVTFSFLNQISNFKHQQREKVSMEQIAKLMKLTKIHVRIHDGIICIDVMAVLQLIAIYRKLGLVLFRFYIKSSCGLASDL